MLSNSDLEKIKEDYPIGTRIRLIYMCDDYPVSSGVKGTVEEIDSEGQLHMKWDDGRTLALIPGVDKFEKIREEKEREER